MLLKKKFSTLLDVVLIMCVFFKALACKLVEVCRMTHTHRRLYASNKIDYMLSIDLFTQLCLYISYYKKSMCMCLLSFSVWQSFRNRALILK